MKACTLCLDYLEADPSCIKDENETCFYVEFPHEVLQGWGMIMPKRHCETVFDLSDVEAGGQDTPHAHLHIIPRFADEPLAGKGIRHAFKSKENLR